MRNKISLKKVEPNEENIRIFTSIQNSVANPKTYRMGYVTEEGAVDRFNDANILFIKKNDQIVGTLEYQLRTSDCAYIKSIAISSEFKHEKIGRKALKLLFDSFLRYISNISLNVHPENHALEIYKSLWFIIVKKIRRNVLLGYEPSLFLTLLK